MSEVTKLVLPIKEKKLHLRLEVWMGWPTNNSCPPFCRMRFNKKVWRWTLPLSCGRLSSACLWCHMTRCSHTWVGRPVLEGCCPGCSRGDSYYALSGRSRGISDSPNRSLCRLLLVRSDWPCSARPRFLLGRLGWFCRTGPCFLPGQLGWLCPDHDRFLPERLDWPCRYFLLGKLDWFSPVCRLLPPDWSCASRPMMLLAARYP